MIFFGQQNNSNINIILGVQEEILWYFDYFFFKKDKIKKDVIKKEDNNKPIADGSEILTNLAFSHKSPLFLSDKIK